MPLQFTMKQHDTLPKRTISLVQTDPTNPSGPMIPVDLTTATSAKLIARTAGGSPTTFTSVLAFGTPRTGGTLIYTPVAGDSAVAGQFQAEVEVTSPTGIETFPNDGYFTIFIIGDLG